MGVWERTGRDNDRHNGAVTCRMTLRISNDPEIYPIRIASWTWTLELVMSLMNILTVSKSFGNLLSVWGKKQLSGISISVKKRRSIIVAIR